jgi:Meiotically up-regulated gene 113
MIAERDGWVYAARKEGQPHTKIGFAGYTPESRMLTLRSQCRAPVILLGAVWVQRVARHIERMLHAQFAPYCIEGEWFALTISQTELEHLVQEALPKALAMADTEREHTRRDLVRWERDAAIERELAPFQRRLAALAKRHGVAPAYVCRLLQRRC